MKKLSVLIPIYNEERTLAEIVRRVMAVKLSGIERELVLVDDCSRDGTKKILKQLKRGNSKFRIIYQPVNQGKGAAIRTAIKAATGDYLLVQDADLEYDPNDIPRLLKPILEGKAEVVYGSRFTGEHRNMLFWHMVGNKFLSLVTNLLYNTTLSDMEVGYKLFTRKALERVELRQPRFGFDPEITAKVLRKGIRIYEVPISYTGREFAEGKKISWKDGFRILWVLLKCRFLIE
jgi:glycosyltransferase involved in cell wall biosynthesis